MGLFDFLKKKKTNVSNVQTSLETKPDNSGEASISLLPSKNLVDELAHFHTMTLDESEAEVIENELLKRGREILPTIVDYLLFCSTGRQNEGWWYNAKRLVKLIRRFPNADHTMHLNRLINQQSNIWEYQTQVKDIAETELRLIERPLTNKVEVTVAKKELNIPTPTSLFRKIEYETPGLHEENIKSLLKYIDRFDSWSESDKGYYFWLLAHNSKFLGYKAASCAFYAADTINRPKTATAAWDMLKTEGLVTTTHSLEVANDIHSKLPIPKTMEEIVNYQLPRIKTEEVSLLTYYWIKFNTDFGTKTVCARNDKGDKFNIGDRVKFNGYGYSSYAIVDKIIDDTPNTKEIYEIYSTNTSNPNLFYLISINTNFGTKTVCARSDKGDKFHIGDRVKCNGFGYSGYAIVRLDKMNEPPKTKEIYEIYPC